ncbi:hypothetical protein J6590_071379 [Homalodisca vitripennis]|nr:hypothetical protein J6590_071379 [Homalodisca vitripennis]
MSANYQEVETFNRRKTCIVRRSERWRSEYRILGSCALLLHSASRTWLCYSSQSETPTSLRNSQSDKFRMKRNDDTVDSR